MELFVNGIVGTFFPTEIAMLFLCYAVTALAAYALGSLNFAIIISKKKHNDDIRNYGSGNAGMTNMLRTYGKGDAILTFAGDMLKTAVAIIIGMLLCGGSHGGNYVAGFFAILGHVFPCWFGFRGGKGVVTAATTILMLNPVAFLIIIAVFIIVVAIWRYISLGSIVSAMLYPLIIYYATGPEAGRTTAVIFALVIAIFVIVLHRKNIERLMTGKESKVKFGKKTGDKETYTVKKENNGNKNKK